MEDFASVQEAQAGITKLFNKAKNKAYFGVPGNLVAYACKVSVDSGYEGFLAFDAKSVLIKHYEQSLGATHFRELRMFIETNAALKLISQYFIPDEESIHILKNHIDFYKLSSNVHLINDKSVITYHYS